MMELLSFLSVLLAVVTLGLGQTTQRVSCNLDDQMACLSRAELSAVKVTVGELLYKNRVLETENNENKVLETEKNDLQEQVQNLTTELQTERNKSVNLQNEVDRLNTSIIGCRQPVVPSCSQPSGSEKFINGGHKSNSSFTEVIPRIQQRNSKSDFYVLNIGTGVYRMSIIEGQLWVPVFGNHTIQILDPNMSSKIKEISLNMNPRSVHQTHSMEVFLAATHGLYVLDIHRSYLYKVGGGQISDIVIDCNKAYAYNYTSNSVVTMGYSAGQWGVTNTFTASSSSIDDGNTITLVGNNIYITSRTSHTIQSYTTTGTHVNTYGVSGSNSPGQLYVPWLCGTDSQGSLLLCDGYNQRLQVLSPGGTWRVYVLQGVRYPRDVVVDTRGNLWVLWYDDNNKSKYRISKFSV